MRGVWGVGRYKCSNYLVMAASDILLQDIFRLYGEVAFEMDLLLVSCMVHGYSPLGLEWVRLAACWGECPRSKFGSRGHRGLHRWDRPGYCTPAVHGPK